jgi:hypothetical protein
VTTLLEFIGGPCAGQHAIEGELPAVQTFARNPSAGAPTPIGVAAYRIDRSDGVPKYHFVGIAQPATFRQGPLNGQSQLLMGGLASPFVFPVHGPTAKVVGEVRYELRGVDQTGTAIYVFTAFIDNRTVEDKALEVIYRFYAKPDYSLYTSKPPTADSHEQVDIRDGNRRASVDCEIVQIIKECWKHGWETLGSCQERPPEWKRPGMAYIWFPIAMHGQEFAKALADAGIDHIAAKEKEWGFGKRNKQGETTERVTCPGRKVFFHKRDFGRIAEALNSGVQ